MVAPFAPLREIQGSELSIADLQDYKYTTNESEQILESFEEAWSLFLDQNSVDLLGETGERIEVLQHTARTALEGKEDLEKELKSEVIHFRKSHDELEQNYKSQLEEIRAQNDTFESNSPIESIQKAFESQKTTQTWLHFIGELDKFAEERELEHPAVLSSSSKVAKPSKRSLALCKSFDLFLAYRIDHELTKYHLKMLAEEIESYETQMPHYETMSKILTKHNVWEILKEKTSKLEP